MPDTAPMPEQNDAQLEADLIERIYKLAISPHAYDDFMDKWADYVDQAMQELTALKREVAAEEELSMTPLSRHFDMGFRLLEELGRNAPATGQKEGVHRAGAASILLDRCGQIVWYNGAASRLFGLRRLSRIDDLALWDRSRTELDKLVASLAHPGDPTGRKTVLRVFSKPADKTLFMLADRRDNGDGEPLVVLNQIVSTWHESVGPMISDSFGLSAAEAEIAECLVEGAAASEIAARRATSVNTVRTQIKALLSKTGVGSQTELVRVLVSLNGAADRIGVVRHHVLRGQTFRFRQRDGRMVPYHRFGPDKGRPFILIHGMLDGCDLTAAAIDLLHHYGLTFFVPERPFFGSAAGTRGSIETAPDRFAEDIGDLLDHLDIESVGLVGHKAGSVYAFAAAARLGSRARVVASVAGGVPLVSNDQFAEMSARQRLVAYTARYTPKLLPFVLRAGIRQLDFGGEDKFMQALYENALADLETVKTNEVAEIVASGYHFSIAQGHRAFEIDSYHVVRDWGGRAALSQAPVLLFHGRHDPVVSLASVEGFAARLGQRARLIVDDNAGQLVLYRNPKLVISTLAALL